MMNCFEWHSRSSDYLDGTLMGQSQREADDHLNTCTTCSERYQHYRQILSSIGSQPRSALPIPIRKSPLGFMLPRLETGARRSRWERTPWFIRTSAEGFGAAFIILLVVAMVPRIRSFYEKSLEHRLDSYELPETSSDETEGTAQAPLARGKTAPLAPADTSEGDEFAAGEESDDSEPTGRQGEEIRVGSSEIWRFNLKTDSPRALQPKIVHALTGLNLAADTPGLGGIEAPGGIQFDLLVPRGVIPGLKNQLQRLASSSAPESVEGLGPNGPFTWYKNKSKRAIPAGKARVVIWLSQM